MKTSTVNALKSIVINQKDFVKNKSTGEWERVEVQVKPTIITQGDSVFISAEDGKGLADYYGEFRGGFPWVDPELEKALEKIGLGYDWENAGTLVVFKA